MPLIAISAVDAIQRLDAFDTLIDARSPSEHAEDRLPDAVNWPSLNDDERRLVGTHYKQVSAFEARKLGAALVARNIAAHIEREVLGKAKDWQPLIYCWRGGQRSGALAHVLGQIGFRVHVLEGGYRAYRRAVIDNLERLPPTLRWRALSGKTGSGKSRLLNVLARLGAQVLDLEGLANHRGSVLGLVPGSPQPGQKQFESRLWDALRRFDPEREVWIESESRKIGDLRVPTALIDSLHASPCVRVELPMSERVQLLMEDYDFFVKDVPAFCKRLDALRVARGNEVVNTWQKIAMAGRVDEVVQDLLVTHYDPMYLQSMRRSFSGFDTAPVLAPQGRDTPSLEAAARSLIELGSRVSPTPPSSSP